MIEIKTQDAPKAIGPYSQAIIAGNFIFLSGQLPIDPKSGNVVDQQISSQTIQVIENIIAILKTQKVGLEQVVKMEVFLKDLNDFNTMNDIYSTYFKHPIKPARTTIQAAKLPRDVLVEIACIALLPSTTPPPASSSFSE